MARKLNDATIDEAATADPDELLPIADPTTGIVRKIKTRHLLYFLDPAVGIILAKPGGGYLQILATGDANDPISFTDLVSLP